MPRQPGGQSHRLLRVGTDARAGARDSASGCGLGSAWHTGSVPQQRRRGEINRFKTDPDCRVFLSTDAGATGLNLQNASIVINCDLPWNPAKLEQRIARAWRKHQTRSVTVVNLVSENTIEHRMLGTLADKQALAGGVLDREGDLKEIKLRGGRQAMLERLEQILSSPKPAAVPRLRQAHAARRSSARFRRGSGADDQRRAGALRRTLPAGRRAYRARRGRRTRRPAVARTAGARCTSEYFADRDPLAPVQSGSARPEHP